MSGADYHEKLAGYFRWYGTEAFGSYEPLYKRICHHIAETPEVVDLIGSHPEDAQQPNVILAAVRYLLDDQPDHPLAAVYAGVSNADPGPLFCEFVLAHRSEIDELMATRRTQTNEVGRTAPIALGLAEIHRRTGKPLAWIDLGCSAGLNLHLDRLRIDYRLDDRVETTGPSNTDLAVECEVVGAFPPVASSAAPIGWRLGLDRAPISPDDEQDTRWLRACVFPSRKERAARLDRALTIAKKYPVELRTGDAAEALSDAIGDAPADLSLTITTSWVWYYLPMETREAVLTILREAGREVHWFSIEAEGVVDGLQLDDRPDGTGYADGSVMALWSSSGPCDSETELLGWSHPHGTWVDWRHSPPR